MKGRLLLRPFVLSALVLGALLLPGAALGAAQILDVHQGLGDLDARAGSVAPSAQQTAIVSNLGATVSWNRFGTPQSLIKYGTHLATGISGPDPVTVARGWIDSNKALFRLSSASESSLELLHRSGMKGTKGHILLFRQSFGNLAAAHDGMINIGLVGSRVAGWNITYVSSSATGDSALAAQAAISPAQALVAAAANVGRTLSVAQLGSSRTERGWTMFDVAGYSHPQRARLVALPTFTNGVRPAYETIILHLDGNGKATAYTSFVDAASGQVLIRENRVDNLAQLAPVTTAFTGTYVPPACGIRHGPYNAPPGTKSIQVAAASQFANDIVLNLYYGNSTTPVVSQDTIGVGVEPEAINYAPTTGVPPGNYFVEVCPFEPDQPTDTYLGSITINDTANTSQTVPYPPKWLHFPANPPIGTALAPPLTTAGYLYPSTDTRNIACWNTIIPNDTPPPNCQPPAPFGGRPTIDVANSAARAPWDQDQNTSLPTFTTRGNQANSAEAWTTPLTPGPTNFRPVSPTREYAFPWTNVWHTSRCSPINFQPGIGNDISASITNLFVEHNRMHDFSYFLGFTESNFNMQERNFGNTAPGPFPGREFDPEIGQAQAGAVNGGFPAYNGRDNANQITLNDGIPGITNMYLWQPIAGAFYSPCVDGDYDMAVIGHEYTHAISNRMIGGPDASLTGTQGRAMGESWSDLTAVEYLNEYGFVPTDGENPFSVGAYVTGNKTRAIRNYNMSASPLNYSDVGYDFVCNGPLVGPPLEPSCPARTQVHADGEIWSATNFQIRQALIDKYNASFPASDASLQRECADGLRQASLCPGNRRWMQIVFDAYLLMPPSVSMLNARDAYLAADVMRFGGANQSELWLQFARRGLGQTASSTSANDIDPKPAFDSPIHSETLVGFSGRAIDEGNTPVKANIYVGHYEAGATPIADTDPATPLTGNPRFVAGTYDFVAVAPGYGHLRFTRTFTGTGGSSAVLNFPTNWASFAKGATPATGSQGVNQQSLIDETEATNWAATGAPVQGRQITIDLAGGVRTFNRVQVSAMLRPELQGEPGRPDPGSQSRQTALRDFEIHVCTAGAPTDPGVNAANPTCLASNPVGFTKIFASTDGGGTGFPGSTPRPVAPELVLRSFDVPMTSATHVQLRVISNQCTGNPQFQGNQDNDALNPTDCRIGSPPVIVARANDVRAAELQVFGRVGSIGAPSDPVVALTKTGPATATRGGAVNYTLQYSNAGPFASQGAKVTDQLPPELTFVSATNGGTYDSSTRRVTWNLGTVNVNATGTLALVARVGESVADGAVIVNRAEFTGELTLSPPTATATTIVLPTVSTGPVMTLEKTGPASSKRGTVFAYQLTYRNAGATAAQNVQVVDTLPAQLRYFGATNGGTYDASTHKVTWNVGSVPAGGSGTLTLRAAIVSSAAVNAAVVNQAALSANGLSSPSLAQFTTTVAP